MMTRAEHLAWCKSRALELLDAGNVTEAFTSMMSDLSKHPDTDNHSGCQLGMLLLISGCLASPDQMRRFLEGFQ